MTRNEARSAYARFLSAADAGLTDEEIIEAIIDLDLELGLYELDDEEPA